MDVGDPWVGHGVLLVVGVLLRGSALNSAVFGRDGSRWRGAAALRGAEVCGCGRGAGSSRGRRCSAGRWRCRWVSRGRSEGQRR
ncbi:hypothetical protein ACFPRL_36095 [Pseudoclavibacter helvolus]